MDGPRDYHTKRSKSEKDKYHMISLICGIYYYSMTQMNLSMKQKQTHRHRGQTCGCQGGGEWGRMGWEFGISRCKPLYIGWMDKQQGPTV